MLHNLLALSMKIPRFFSFLFFYGTRTKILYSCTTSCKLAPLAFCNKLSLQGKIFQNKSSIILLKISAFCGNNFFLFSSDSTPPHWRVHFSNRLPLQSPDFWSVAWDACWASRLSRVRVPPNTSFFERI